MNLVQVLLAYRFLREFPNAIIKSALNDQVRCDGIAGAFIFDRRPFSEAYVL